MCAFKTFDCLAQGPRCDFEFLGYIVVGQHHVKRLNPLGWWLVAQVREHGVFASEAHDQEGEAVFGHFDAPLGAVVGVWIVGIGEKRLTQICVDL